MTRHNQTLTPASIPGIALLAVGLLILPSCADEESLNPSGSTCGVLSSVQSSTGGSIAGNQSTGGFSDYGFSAGANEDISITPPSATPCGNEVAQQLQGLCAVCETDSEQACNTLVTSLFDPSNSATFPESCAACGDGFCTAGETASMSETDKTLCPEDCGRSQCGDGECNFFEDATCDGRTDTCFPCPLDCTGGSTCGDDDCGADETPESCPEDCANACGNGDCDPGETTESCPADCSGTAMCGDGRCVDGVETAGSCAADCQECGDGICSAPIDGDENSGSETPQTCSMDCMECEPDRERCNGDDREVCSFQGMWDTLMCPGGMICAPTEEDRNLTECVAGGG